jgi:hypothetical protein
MTRSTDEPSAYPNHGSVFSAWQSIASVVAPLTIVTATLKYIGWVRYRAIFGYFGVHPALTSFTPQDYLFHSGVVGFGGVLLLALAGAVLLIADRLIIKAFNRFPEPLRFLRATLALSGIVLVLLGLGSATTTVMRASVPPASGAIMLALGTLLVLRYGLTWNNQRRLLPPAAPAFCAVLCLIAGFWALTAYAQDLGNGAARNLDQNIEHLPLVTVYSREPLDLAGSSVLASRVLDQDEKWSYRYSGARLLIYSNSRWFLIPEPPSEYYRSSVTVLRDTEKIRVEVAEPK